MACHAILRSFALADQKWSSLRFIGQQRGKRRIPEKDERQTGREKKSTKTFCFTSEGEPRSGNVEAERSGESVWYPEELDRDI